MTLPGLPQGISRVDCGSCRRCCRGRQLIVLTEMDNPADYDCYEFQPEVFALRRAPNGDCIYLGPDGCTIWGKHPTICKMFDCVDFVLRMDAGAYAHVGPNVDNATVQEGRKRLKARTLKKAKHAQT